MKVQPSKGAGKAESRTPPGFAGRKMLPGAKEQQDIVTSALWETSSAQASSRQKNFKSSLSIIIIKDAANR